MQYNNIWMKRGCIECVGFCSLYFFQMLNLNYWLKPLWEVSSSSSPMQNSTKTSNWTAVICHISNFPPMLDAAIGRLDTMLVPEQDYRCYAAERPLIFLIIIWLHAYRKVFSNTSSLKEWREQSYLIAIKPYYKRNANEPLQNEVVWATLSCVANRLVNFYSNYYNKVCHSFCRKC